MHIAQWPPTKAKLAASKLISLYIWVSESVCLHNLNIHANPNVFIYLYTMSLSLFEPPVTVYLALISAKNCYKKLGGDWEGWISRLIRNSVPPPPPPPPNNCRQKIRQSWMLESIFPRALSTMYLTCNARRTKINALLVTMCFVVLWQLIMVTVRKTILTRSNAY